MCIILVGKITAQQHYSALAQNSDGFSLFTAKTGLVKSPTKKQVYQALNQFGIWHYRIGTSGKKDTTNIHPFQICGGDYLLYHNGILGAGKGERSDTNALAETLFSVSLEVARTAIAALSSRQRFVIVSAVNPKEFYLYGDWECDEGVLMSHKLYGGRVLGYNNCGGGRLYGGQTSFAVSEGESKFEDS